MKTKGIIVINYSCSILCYVDILKLLLSEL